MYIECPFCTLIGITYFHCANFIIAATCHVVSFVFFLPCLACSCLCLKINLFLFWLWKKYSNVRNTLHCGCFALSAVLKDKMMDENKFKCIQHENIVGWTRKCWMKSLTESKLHPASSSRIFFFFFNFF